MEKGLTKGTSRPGARPAKPLHKKGTKYPKTIQTSQLGVMSKAPVVGGSGTEQREKVCVFAASADPPTHTLHFWGDRGSY